MSQREQARRDKNWPEADRLRALLLEDGVMLKDRPEGTSWYFVTPPQKQANT